MEQRNGLSLCACMHSFRERLRSPGGQGLVGQLLQEGSTRGRQLLKNVIAAVVKVCQSELPEGVIHEALSLLGELGAVSPEHVELSTAEPLRMTAELSDAGAPGVNALIITAKVTALKLLLSYLSSPDTNTSMMALATIKAILSRRQYGTLLDACSPEVQTLLKAFCTKRATPKSARSLK
ncbi:unnamed protein product, partial [Chrysoparadoxa australica]